MDNSETLADILAEVRAGPFSWSSPSEIPGVEKCNSESRDLADRIEAAYAREKVEAVNTPGNAAAMREALSQCELFLGNVSRHGHPTLNPGDKCTACVGVDELRGMVVRTLAAPPRNCDIGTPAEQAMRFRKFCHLVRTHSCDCSNNCPFINEPDIIHCQFAWAQMPYEEGGQECER